MIPGRLTVGEPRCVTHRELLRILCVRRERDIAGKTTFLSISFQRLLG